jgi:hypothetical protein
MLSELASKLNLPTPVASLISSLAALALVAVFYLVVQLLRGRGRRKTETWFDRIIERGRAVDRAIVRTGSWVTGTRHKNPLVRRMLVVSVFTAFAVAGALLEWPWGLLGITLGVLAIFIVFRHWSRDEDEALAEGKFEDKDIAIRGDLSFEVMVACCFILVFAPVAFAQIADAGLGFQLKPEAAPFAFLLYALIELIKAGSLVDYYDLFADQLPFDRMSDVKQSGAWAKGAVLSYRVALSLLLLAALKRLVDIARRRAEGADLRHIQEMLRDGGGNADDLVDQLKRFALKGRGNAQLLLERILTPEKSDGWHLGVDVRLAAADALQEYSEHRGGTGALYAAIDGYRRILIEDWPRAKHPQMWAMIQHNLANALQRLGDREVSPVRLAWRC